MTMIGSGVEFGYRNTIWVGRDIAAEKPLGIVRISWKLGGASLFGKNMVLTGVSCLD